MIAQLPKPRVRENVPSLALVAVWVVAPWVAVTVTPASGVPLPSWVTPVTV